MDNNQAMRDFLREKIDKDIVMKYLFIKGMGEFYDDEYLTRMYRIDVLKIRQQYDALEQNKRNRIEKDIRDQIVAGEVDLSKEAVIWHREALKRKVKKETNRKNISKSGKGKER